MNVPATNTTTTTTQDHQTDSYHNHGHDHSHDHHHPHHTTTTQTVGVVDTTTLLQQQKNDPNRLILYRYKGILAVKGMNEKYVFQGVGMIFQGQFWPNLVWKHNNNDNNDDDKDVPPRQSQFVFIGKNLKRHELQADFEACLVTDELRFDMGSIVQVHVGNGVWRYGIVMAHWDQGNPYRIRLHPSSVESGPSSLQQQQEDEEEEEVGAAALQAPVLDQPLLLPQERTPAMTDLMISQQLLPTTISTTPQLSTPPVVTEMRKDDVPTVVSTTTAATTTLPPVEELWVPLDVDEFIRSI